MASDKTIFDRERAGEALETRPIICARMLWRTTQLSARARKEWSLRALRRCSHAQFITQQSASQRTTEMRETVESSQLGNEILEIDADYLNGRDRSFAPVCLNSVSNRDTGSSACMRTALITTTNLGRSS